MHAIHPNARTTPAVRAEIVRRRSCGDVLPWGRHASINGSSFFHCASASIAPSNQEGQNAHKPNRFKFEQAVALQLHLPICANSLLV